MQVVNIHERSLDAPVEKVGELIDGLASPNDRLWPIDRWPAMQLDRPLGVGASGGHGPIRYLVESYSPGRSVQFRFTEPKGFVGVHRFETEMTGDGNAILRHVIEMRTVGSARLAWAIAVRPLHDALIEDAFDRAERFLGKRLPERRLSPWVRFLRRLMRRRAKKR